MEKITNNDLFLGITEVKNIVKETNIRLGSVEDKLTKLENEVKVMREELKHDVQKMDKKVTLLANDLLEAKADISILQEVIE